MKYGFSLAVLVTLALGCSGSDHPMSAGEGGESSSAGGQLGSGGTNQGGGGVSGAAGSNASSGAGQGGSGNNEGGSGSIGGAGGTGGIDGEIGGAGGDNGGAGGERQLSPGEALYMDNCFACHGPSGIGGPLAPEIQHPVSDYTVWMVRNGSDARGTTTYAGPMIPLDETAVSPADLDLIIEYLNSMPQPTSGEALFYDYCANCHGADGKGGPTTRDLTAIDNLATEVPANVREGHHPGEFNLRIEYMPAQDASRLSDAELALIADYIATL